MTTEQEIAQAVAGTHEVIRLNSHDHKKVFAKLPAPPEEAIKAIKELSRFVHEMIFENTKDDNAIFSVAVAGDNDPDTKVLKLTPQPKGHTANADAMAELASNHVMALRLFGTRQYYEVKGSANSGLTTILWTMKEGEFELIGYGSIFEVCEQLKEDREQDAMQEKEGATIQ